MDFSAILILPVSAIVAFAVVISAAIINRPAPLLIWPCAFSVMVAALIFLRAPDLSTIGTWLMSMLALAFSAAMGTVIGGIAARIAVKFTVTLHR